MQVSPTEIEDTLLAQPDRLIIDVAVAGVSGGRTVDEKIPRAWIVLSEAGMTRGPVAVVQTLETWSRQNLSKYKWLRGGVEIVENVLCFCTIQSDEVLLTRVLHPQIPRSPTGKVLRRVLQDHYEARMQQMRSKL
jgi:acyl-CoA synthetase (AMP-forming)/AMP-acid ligase II